MKKHFEIIGKEIKLKKDCKQCASYKVCKFHSKMYDLCKSDEFYQMNEYLEWNNSLEAFELNSSCQFYRLKYKIPEDDALNLDVDQSILAEVASIELEKMYDVLQYSWKIPDDKIIAKIKGQAELVEVKISDLIKGYKFFNSNK